MDDVVPEGLINRLTERYPLAARATRAICPSAHANGTSALPEAPGWTSREREAVWIGDTDAETVHAPTSPTLITATALYD
ncbi:hypothetical protein [Mycolicibacterium stellerae]|uniref:hypothetical protein n=1 Tax=Mycolicibacterium stellerae TaxID=2358193 RepID=UPI0019D139FD|nr:hypothetical protein [Mycolicibacterium stellerae]